MTDLLPCPFCGAEAKNNGHRSCDCCGKAYTGIVSCTKCTAEVSHLDTDAEAIAAWNARAPAQQPLNREAVANAIINNMPRLNGLNAAVDAIMALALPSTDRRTPTDCSVSFPSTHQAAPHE